MMLLYLTVMLKPFAPIVLDRFAHAFAEAEHISTVHAIYGANHLENRLADMASENESGKSRHALTGSCEVPLHIAIITLINIFIPVERFISYLLFPVSTFSDVFIPLDERPPQAS